LSYLLKASSKIVDCHKVVGYGIRRLRAGTGHTTNVNDAARQRGEITDCGARLLYVIINLDRNLATIVIATISYNILVAPSKMTSGVKYLQTPIKM